MAAPEQTDAPPPLDQRQLARIVRFYAEAGIDAAIDSLPHDRFAQSALAAAEREAAPAPPPAAAPPRRAPLMAEPPRARPAPAPVASPREAEDNARACAATALSLDELRAALERFDGCALKATATQLVFEDGSRNAGIMLVGDTPGADEDRTGKPFEGRAGQLLDNMLAAIGLDRASVYLANIVPWRPPGNRAPTAQETAACLPFIARQIELANPDILICLGKAPVESLLGLKGGLSSLRGRWSDYETGTRKIRAMPMLHPDYLLKAPAQKRLAWRDLQEIQKALAAVG